MIAPAKRPHEQDELGVFQRGNTVVKTLIGQMPQVGTIRHPIQDLTSTLRSNRQQSDSVTKLEHTISDQLSNPSSPLLLKNDSINQGNTIAQDTLPIV